MALRPKRSLRRAAPRGACVAVFAPRRWHRRPPMGNRRRKLRLRRQRTLRARGPRKHWSSARGADGMAAGSAHATAVTGGRSRRYGDQGTAIQAEILKALNL